MDEFTRQDLISLVGAISTALAVFVAMIAILWQSHLTRQVQSVTMLRDYDREFNEEILIKARLVLAESLLSKLNSPTPAGHESENLLIGQYAMVPDFFTTIGILVNKRILDVEMVWSGYYYWVRHYWVLLWPYIETLREKQGDKTYYTNFQRLHNRLNKYQKKRDKLSYRAPTEDALREFLHDEVLKCTVFWKVPTEPAPAPTKA
jgi:hypothetical protein